MENFVFRAVTRTYIHIVFIDEWSLHTKKGMTSKSERVKWSAMDRERERASERVNEHDHAIHGNI